MAKTPNHGYNVPSKGAQDWHVPLNKNFKRYDTDIEIRDADSNRGNYTAKQGAKFLATDTERVYLGDGSSWNALATSGRSPTFNQINSRGEFLGIGRSNSIGAEYFGVGTPAGSGSYGGMYIETSASDGLPFYGYATNGNYRVWHTFDGGSDEWILVMPSGNVTVTSDGTINATGSKNFVQSVDTDDGEKEVVYTATEAGTAHTEASGVAVLEDGRADVELPDHFGWVTSEDEPLMVQVTPHAREKVHPQVTSRSADRIVIEDFEDDAASYEVSYTVKGTRDGYEDSEVVREPTGGQDSQSPGT